MAADEENVRHKVQVWVYLNNTREGRYYFLLLQTLPNRGGFWQPVTGSVDEDESLMDAARREAKEESGLQFKGEPRAVGSPQQFKSRGEHVLEQGFMIEADCLPGVLPSVTLDEREHSNSRWVPEEEAFPLLKFESNTQVLREVIQKLHRAAK